MNVLLRSCIYKHIFTGTYESTYVEVCILEFVDSCIPRDVYVCIIDTTFPVLYYGFFFFFQLQTGDCQFHVFSYEFQHSRNSSVLAASVDA